MAVVRLDAAEQLVVVAHVDEDLRVFADGPVEDGKGARFQVRGVFRVGRFRVHSSSIFRRLTATNTNNVTYYGGQSVSVVCAACAFVAKR